MQAAILSRQSKVESKPLIYSQVSTPKPDNSEILIKVSACGVCRTDLHIVEGDIPVKKLPLIPGHQVVGIVEGVGRNEMKFKIGARVGIGWLNHTCGTCHYCRRGRENLCENAEFTGYTKDGGYAQYVTVNEQFAHTLPNGFSDIEVAPLLCAGVIGYRAYKFTQVRKGDTLGLVGFGASAHLVIQVARHFGVKVNVFTREESHRKLAKKLGADWVGKIEDVPSEKLTAAILFAPVGELVPRVLKHIEKGGRLVINAIHMTPIPPLDYSLLWPERQVLNVANGTRQDANEFLKLAAKIKLKPQVTTFPMSEANQALLLLKEGNIQGSAVLTGDNS